MNDIITIPAGVIMPKDLLTWLRKKRDEAMNEAAQAFEENFDEDGSICRGRAEAFQEVIMHVSHG